jgi:hypothetical protein
MSKELTDACIAALYAAGFAVTVIAGLRAYLAVTRSAAKYDRDVATMEEARDSRKKVAASERAKGTDDAEADRLAVESYRSILESGGIKQLTFHEHDVKVLLGEKNKFAAGIREAGLSLVFIAVGGAMGTVASIWSIWA